MPHIKITLDQFLIASSNHKLAAVSWDYSQRNLFEKKVIVSYIPILDSYLGVIHLVRTQNLPKN